VLLWGVCGDCICSAHAGNCCNSTVVWVLLALRCSVTVD
jgi:hypothetical protein